MQFDTLEEWKEIYRSAGLTDLQIKTGPFEMMTPRGFLEDEGLANSLRLEKQARQFGTYGYSIRAQRPA
jgi:hypothetical protein